MFSTCFHMLPRASTCFHMLPVENGQVLFPCDALPKNNFFFKFFLSRRNWRKKKAFLWNGIHIRRQRGLKLGGWSRLFRRTLWALGGRWVPTQWATASSSVSQSEKKKIINLNTAKKKRMLVLYTDIFFVNSPHFPHHLRQKWDIHFAF